MTQSRRLRLYAVPQREMRSMLQWAKGMPQRILFPTIVNGPPEDAVLEEVRHDWNRDAFFFRFSHPSFDEVPDGCIIPYVDESASIVWRDMELLPLDPEWRRKTADLWARLSIERPQAGDLLVYRVPPDAAYAEVCATMADVVKTWTLPDGVQVVVLPQGQDVELSEEFRTLREENERLKAELREMAAEAGRVECIAPPRPIQSYDRTKNPPHRKSRIDDIDRMFADAEAVTRARAAKRELLADPT